MPTETTALTVSDLHYLRSIQRNLEEYRTVTSQLVEVRGFGSADDALADNRDWLGCFIERHTRSAENAGRN